MVRNQRIALPEGMPLVVGPWVLSSIGYELGAYRVELDMPGTE